MQKIILIGDNGHSKVIEDCIHSNGDVVIAKLDDQYSERVMEGTLVKGPIAILPELFEVDLKIFIAIEQNQARKKIVDLLGLPSQIYATVIHKSAIISPTAEIGFGTVVMPGTVVNADSKIGEHAIINSNSTIEYNCLIEDFVHVSSAAVATGNVQLAEGSHLGASATVIAGQSIGAWAIIGAGSVVVSDIEGHVTVTGVPAKVIKEEEF